MKSAQTPQSRITGEKLTVPQLVKKFTAFYGNCKFTTAFTRTPNLSVYRARPIQSTPFLFIKGPFNIILPSSPRSSKWSLSFRFPHQDLERLSPLPHTWQMSLPPPSPWFDHPYAQYVMSSTDHKGTQYAVSFSVP